MFWTSLEGGWAEAAGRGWRGRGGKTREEGVCMRVAVGSRPGIWLLPGKSLHSRLHQHGGGVVSLTDCIITSIMTSRSELDTTGCSGRCKVNSDPSLIRLQVMVIMVMIVMISIIIARGMWLLLPPQLRRWQEIYSWKVRVKAKFLGEKHKKL